jgi:hypothetical protein
LSFNYDLGADYAIDVLDRPIDYGLLEQPLGPLHIPLLKLHGSLNWAMHDSGGRKFVACSLPVRNIGEKVIESAGNSQTNVPIRVRRYIGGTPVIVPPTWAKSDYYQTVSRVWRRAADELKTAENIYVLGYSMPPTDEFFRLLFALGSAGATRLKRFWVFDPNATVEVRFRGLLGQAAVARFEFFPEIFSQGLQKLTRRLMDQGVVRPPQ